uniref:Coiled-coil domain-containing protein 22 homolog n=1 Tax=Strigamia maritima TaxID=126957 RepID=T1JM55_STRMM
MAPSIHSAGRVSVIMEEVDHIIIQQFRQIDDIDDKVDRLKEFSTELIIEATVRCLRVIKPNIELSHHLPPGMSARFRLGSILAQTCVDLGYQGEIGYQTFLYSDEADIRRVFMFLLEKLPKDIEKTIDEPLSSSALFNQAISEEISRQLELPWLPNFCKNKGIRWKGDTWSREGTSYMSTFTSSFVRYPVNLEDLSKKIPNELQTFYRFHLPQLTLQFSNCAQIIPSVLEDHANCLSATHDWENEWNEFGLASRLTEQEYRVKKKQKIQMKLAAFIQQEVQKSSLLDVTSGFSGYKHENKIERANESLENVGTTQEPEEEIVLKNENTRLNTEEDAKVKRTQEINEMESNLQALNKQLEMLQIQTKKLTAGIQLAEEQLKQEQTKAIEIEDLHRIKQKTFDLLPDADSNMRKLQALIETSSKRLVSLANQWEKHRVPLVEEYRQLRETGANKLSETQRKIEEIKSTKEKTKELLEESRQKEEQHKQSVSDYEKNSKDINRAAYTRRILEIVANIKKQKLEIDKVLLDTKDVQKEINQLTGKRDRTFTETDNLVFKDAKKDEAVRKAYKHLAALHENCGQLIKTVEETGAITREIRDLEDQIENESQKKVQENLERIMADYKQMKQENTTNVDVRTLSFSRSMLFRKHLQPLILSLKNCHGFSSNAICERLSRGIIDGRRSCLAEGITLIETSHPEKKNLGQQVLQIIVEHQRKEYINRGKDALSFRIGLSGPPGSGKSTFIEAFGQYLTSIGNKVAVLAVDPSSSTTGGSLLGDKTRMLNLSRDPNAYIRPSPTRGKLGGVTRTTLDAIALCEAAGFNVIIVETVGVGQSEHSAVDMVDMFLLLLAPASGDELQGIKRGIVEISDLIIINKADGDLKPAATRTSFEFTSALKFVRPRSKLWRPIVRKISSLNKNDFPAVWDLLSQYRSTMLESGTLEKRRKDQLKKCMWNYISDNIMESFINHPQIQNKLKTIENDVMSGEIPPGRAADSLLKQFFK